MIQSNFSGRDEELARVVAQHRGHFQHPVQGMGHAVGSDVHQDEASAPAVLATDVAAPEPVAEVVPQEASGLGAVVPSHLGQGVDPRMVVQGHRPQSIALAGMTDGRWSIPRWRPLDAVVTRYLSESRRLESTHPRR